jgi:two-component system CheB/CheR fusion protein
VSVPWAAEEFERFLEFLKEKRGLDFTGYKRASVARRVSRRMQAAEVESLGHYMDRLEVDPQEFVQLLNTILINVTAFFRDAPAWEFLSKEIVPEIIAHKDPNAFIRLWSAGCASGEEAYSLAMVLAEALGEAEFTNRVKIYATDIDEEALGHARRATYTPRELEGVSADLLARYFRQSGTQYTFHPELRRAVVFGLHNLLTDAPISNLDLLVCRNTLMYFSAESQRRVIALFHFAIQNTGFLFLGRAEMLQISAPLFAPVNTRHRVFRKVPSAAARERVYLPPAANGFTLAPFPPSVRLREMATEGLPVAALLVDAGGALLSANAAARALSGLSREDMGKPLQDLSISYRPVELRSRIEQAIRQRRPLREAGIAYQSGGDTHYLALEVQPLLDDVGTSLGANVLFADITHEHELHAALDRMKAELQSALEELQSTNEELETTNEELQSSNEELETTNEELQSSNEELETMSEELQSSNEELHTANEQLRVSTDDLNRTNSFLSSIMGSLRVAVAVVDPNMTVLMWNRQAEEMWGLRDAEVVGSFLMNLDIGLPLERLRPPLRRVAAGESGTEEIAVEATNRRGRTIQCGITITPLVGPIGERQGAVVLMEDVTEGRQAAA